MLFSDDANCDRVMFDFRHRPDAWAFMRACEPIGVKAGYPNLEAGSYRVTVLVPSDRLDEVTLLAEHNNVRPFVIDPSTEVATLRLVCGATMTITRAQYSKLGARRVDRDGGARTELYAGDVIVATIAGTIEHIENAFDAPIS
jgi:hypothetical protein